MATEDLVQDNLPHGEREKRVAAMRQAGVPLETGQSGAGPVPSASPASPAGSAPSEIDALTLLQPSAPDESVPQLSASQQLQQIADAAPPGLMKQIVQRVARKL